MALPSDLMIEIICRLPAKSLVRFRCVSKGWRFGINHQYIIRLHLIRSALNNSHSRLVIAKDAKLSLVDLSNPLHIAEEVNDSLIQLINGSVELLGTCHGLLCLSSSGYNKIILWNMSTREHLTLPTPPENFRRDSLWKLFGFGYDHVNDDYKVIRVSQAIDSEHKAIFYSLRSKSWGKIHDYSSWICIPPVRGVYLNGAIHWLASVTYGQTLEEKGGSIIVSINLSTQKQRILRLPDQDREFEDKFSSPYRFLFASIGVLGGQLCAMDFYDWRRHTVGIWVMNKYRVKESWTWLFSIPRFDIGIDYFLPLHRCVHLLAYSKNGDEVLVGIGDLKLLYYYNLKNGNVSFVNEDTPDLNSSIQVQTCNESLVPIDV